MPKRLLMTAVVVGMALQATSVASAARNERSWMCSPNATTTFRFNGRRGQWLPSTLPYEYMTPNFVLRRPYPEEMDRFATRPAWVISMQMGERSNVSTWCPNEPAPDGFMSCIGLNMIIVNVKEGRYIETIVGNYMTRGNAEKVDRPGAEPPAMILVSCAPI
jgi:hypothetical protein